MRCTSKNCVGYFKLIVSVIRVTPFIYPPCVFCQFAIFSVYIKSAQAIGSDIGDNHTRGIVGEFEFITGLVIGQAFGIDEDTREPGRGRFHPCGTFQGKRGGRHHDQLSVPCPAAQGTVHPGAC